MDLTKEWYKFYERNVPAEIEQISKALPDVIDETAKASPGKTILYSLGKKLKYKELINDVNRFASGLIQLGIKKGDRICLLLPNLIQFPVAHLAILRVGAISVPVNPLLTTFEIGKVIGLCEPRMLIVLADFYHKVREFRKNTSVEKIIVTGAVDYSPQLIRILYKIKPGVRPPVIDDPDILSFNKLVKSINSPKEFPLVSPDDTAVLLSTGGINGVLKLAELTHRNITSNAVQIMHWVSGSRGKDDSVLGVIPLFHSFGITLCLHFCLLAGVKLILLPRFNVKKVLKTIKRFRINFFPGVPAMFSSLLDHRINDKSVFSSLKFCLSGGDVLNNELLVQFEQKTGVKIIDSYGLTEASPAAISNPLLGLRKTESIGIPLSSTLAMVADPETGKPLPAGVTGELAIKGPQVMKGYWKNQEETSLVIKDNWLFTGDRARMDKDNYLFLEGRFKKLIIHCGFNVFPAEVEIVLKKHPSVKKVKVIGKKEKNHGESVMAYIVPAGEHGIKEKELKDYCRKFLAGFKVPGHFKFVSDLQEFGNAESSPPGMNPENDVEINFKNL